MRIRKLELFGFKSFPDRTAFEFGSGISCVVGPNGSGKSNVVDALRWCIGEQSARSLRGQDMADVIFAGSSERSPVGFAEVTLTLSAEGGEPFPGDWSRFEELEVGRRLYRDGTSEYLVNRVKCRRRDVVDLFLDTGVGSNLYSFIAQGQVDRIVSQSAGERRGLIDEAAGISRYKARRDEALARLTATASQLDRASDVADEMGRRLEVLERQVLRAGQFRRSRARIRQREIALGVAKYAGLASDRRALRESHRRADDELGALKRAIERQEGDLAERAAELASVRDAATAWRDQAGELEAQRREAEGVRALHEARRAELHEAAERARRRAATAADEASRARIEAASASELADQQDAGQDPEAVVGARRTRDLAVAALREVRDTLSAVQAREAAREERWRSARDEIARTRLRLDQLGPGAPPPTGVEGCRQAVVDAERRREAARAAVSEAEARADAARARVQEAEAADDAARTLAERAGRAWEASRAELERTRAALVQAASRRRAADLAAAEEQARRERAAIETRAAAWIGALRAHAAARAKGLEAAHRAAVERSRSDAAERDRTIEADERRALEQVEAGLDRTALDAARGEFERAGSALAAAERTLAEAADHEAVLRGRLLALEAEWRAMESTRQAGLPAAWKQRRPLGADDARTVARPELIGLPVLNLDDLGGSVGRGVLGAGAVRWRVAPDRATALAQLAEYGPPVVASDGSVRADADGVVELGWRTEPAWRDLSGAVAGLKAELAVAAEASARASAERQACEEAVRRTRTRREDADRQLAAARTSAIAAVRQGTRSLRERAAANAASDADRLHRERTSDTERSREELTRAVGLAEACRDALVRAVSPSPPPTAWLRANLGRVWPADLPPRPALLPPADLGDLRAEVRQIEQQRSKVRQEGEQATIAAEQAARSLAAAERALAEHAIRESSRQREVDAARERLASLQSILDAPTEAEAHAETRSRAEAAEHALQAAEHHWRDLETAQVQARERAHAARERAARALAEAARADQEGARAAVEVVEALEGAASAEREATAAEQRSAELAAERAQVLERATRERDRASRLLAEHDRVSASLVADRARADRAAVTHRDLVARVEAVQQEIEVVRGRLGDRYQVSIPGLLDHLWMRKELVIEPDPAAAEALRVGEETLPGVSVLTITTGMLDDEDAVLAMVAELEAERRALEQLGEVNLAAEDEYRDLLGRWTDLDAQRADLEASVQSIRAAIAKTNRICRERFRDAYDRVNEAFQASYPRLVGGGDARLALTDEEDLLETGVDIFVRPPGKRLQNLSLLSGGEKAMTAIALLLALFQVKPSPFCVLDEVDAPLDEANGGRFNDMVREMSRVSQFIVITHNRRTMECADVLYGVTMARPGVSTLVSVALERRI